MSFLRMGDIQGAANFVTFTSDPARASKAAAVHSSAPSTKKRMTMGEPHNLLIQEQCVEAPADSSTVCHG